MVSIHAPVWGATIPQHSRHLVDCFNPRTRVGCDQKQVRRFSVTKFQSTHPCGVRHFSSKTVRAMARFNPRTRVGCDRQTESRPLPPIEFQSTHPCGVRRASYSNSNAVQSFNPRTRVGCDLLSYLASCYGGCFNPRTRVGCDGCQATTTARYAFQSTHPCGVRPKTKGH